MARSPSPRSSSATPSMTCGPRRRRWNGPHGSSSCTVTCGPAGKAPPTSCRGWAQRPLAADDDGTKSAVEAVWRIESPRLIAGLTRITGDVGTAEELAQDALVIALEQWPVRGVPDGPGAWLMATAKHRAIDLVRRRARYDRKLREVGRDMESQVFASWEPDVGRMDDHIGDDL